MKTIALLPTAQWKEFQNVTAPKHDTKKSFAHSNLDISQEA